MLCFISKRMGYLILFTAMCASYSMAGSVSGTVVDERGNLLDDMTVHLEDSEGNRHSAVTKEGHYAFTDLQGAYLVYLEKYSDFRIFSPPCGFYSGVLGPGDHNTHGFGALRGSGVMVDFGTTHGGGKMAAPQSNTLNIDMDITNVAGMSPAPNRVVVTGYFSVPGQGVLSPTAVMSSQAGAYVGSDLSVTTQVIGGPVVKLTLNYFASPHIDIDGLIASLSVSLNSIDIARVNAGDGDVSFCVTSVEIFQSKGGLVELFSDAFMLDADHL